MSGYEEDAYDDTSMDTGVVPYYYYTLLLYIGYFSSTSLAG
jgi:hypothetical protein